MSEETNNKASRRWTLTLWKNPCGMKELTMKSSYFLAVKETCPKTQKVHWQAYAEFEKAVRMAHVKKWLNDKSVHCAQSAGTGEENVSYCKKTIKDAEVPPVNDGETFVELGEISMGQGFRRDLLETKRKRDDGTWTLTDIMENVPHLAMQYRNGWRDVEKYAQKKKAKGLTEAEFVQAEVENTMEVERFIQGYPDAFVVPDNGMFDEYQGEDVIIYRERPMAHERMSVITHTPLPGKYNTTYANWTKHIWVRSLGLPARLGL